MKNIVFGKMGGVQHHVLAFVHSTFARCFAGVAIRTTDRAFRDLLEDGRPSPTRRTHERDISAFIAQVVEMKNNGISLAAIDARMRRQVLPDPALVFVLGRRTPFLDVCSVSIPVAFIPEALVFNKAALAPRVTDAELYVPEPELIDRLLQTASAADLRL